MSVVLHFARFCLFAGAVSSWSYAGQIYPGSQYPGQYPGEQPPGGGGLTLPKHNKKNKNKAAEPEKPNFTADGQVISLDNKTLVVGTEDGRLLTLSVTPGTVWQRDAKPAALADLKPGMVVHLDAFENDEAYLTAATVNVTAEKALQRRPPPEAAAEAPAPKASEPVPEFTQAPDPTALGEAPDDPDRPVLHRGKSTVTAARRQTATAKPASPKPEPKAAAAKSGGDLDFTIEGPADQKKLSTGRPSLIMQTMDWVTGFTSGLPNYLCQQLTTRYMEQSKSEGWQPVDIVTAKLVYENGGESYRDITVGGKRVNKSMMDIGGTTSTGEFAATLRDLFAPETAAEFQFSKGDVVGSTEVSVYHYNVDLFHSHWTIKVGGQQLRPPYSGEVWINKKTGEVRKIEMQADAVPANFPMRDIFSSVAYDPVRLGTGNFLLPVVAVLQSCDRKSSVCSKNDVEWRDYHKYSGESTITYQ